MGQGYDKQVMELLSKAKALACDLEPWPNYFESKTREFMAITDFIDIRGRPSVLEIGCGNGYTSGLLAGISENVVAFDLPNKNPARHSVGIGAAVKFMGIIGMKNVRVIGGSAENLPFDDESFDLIFSEYMLQYVPDKDKAVSEMVRVLKPGGVILTVLPNFVTRLYAPVMQYRYLVARIWYRLARTAKRLFPVAGRVQPSLGADANLPVAAKNVLDYLLLRPDGAYRSFREELVAHLPWAWKALFTRNGLRIKKTFSTEVIPLLLFNAISIRSAGLIAKNYNRLNRVLGDLPVLGECGYSIGIIAYKV